MSSDVGIEHYHSDLDVPGSVGYDWDYFRFPDIVTAHMIPYGNNIFEFVMVVSLDLPVILYRPTKDLLVVK